MDLQSDTLGLGAAAAEEKLKSSQILCTVQMRSQLEGYKK